MKTTKLSPKDLRVLIDSTEEASRAFNALGEAAMKSERAVRTSLTIINRSAGKVFVSFGEMNELTMAVQDKTLVMNRFLDQAKRLKKRRMTGALIGTLLLVPLIWANVYLLTKRDSPHFVIYQSYDGSHLYDVNFLCGNFLTRQILIGKQTPAVTVHDLIGDRMSQCSWSVDDLTNLPLVTGADPFFYAK